MEAMLAPTNPLEMFADFSGSLLGTLISQKGLVLICVGLFFGLFRRSYWWFLLIVFAVPAMILNQQLPHWNENQIPDEVRRFMIAYLFSSYFLTGTLGYCVGRKLTTLKHRRS